MNNSQVNCCILLIALTLFGCGKDPNSVPTPITNSYDVVDISVVTLDSIPDGSGYTYIAVPTQGRSQRYYTTTVA